MSTEWERRELTYPVSAFPMRWHDTRPAFDTSLPNTSATRVQRHDCEDVPAYCGARIITRRV